MKHVWCLALVLASPCLGQVAVDDPAFVEPRVLEFAPQAIGAFEARGARALVYQNIREGDAGSLYFTATGVHHAMEFLSLERVDSGGRVASPVRLRSMDVALNAEDPRIPFVVDVTFYATFRDWGVPGGGVVADPVGSVTTTVDPGGASSVVLHLDLDMLGGVRLPRGQCAIEVRCRHTGKDPGPSGFPVFRSGEEHAGPDVGYSADNFYSDSNLDGLFSGSERKSLGGYPHVANLALTLYTDASCALDIDGNGAVNAKDIDEIVALFEEGCP